MESLEEILANPAELIRQLAILEQDTSPENLALAADIRAAVAARPELAAVQDQIDANPLLASNTSQAQASFDRLAAAGLPQRAQQLQRNYELRQAVVGKIGDAGAAVGRGFSAVGDALGQAVTGAARDGGELLNSAGAAVRDFVTSLPPAQAPSREMLPEAAPNSGQGPIADARALLDPQGQAAIELAALQATGAVPVATGTGSPATLLPQLPSVPPTILPSPAATPGNLIPQLGTIVDPRIAQQAQAQAAIQRAQINQLFQQRQQVETERALQALALQQVPQDGRNNLANAAVNAVTPGISGQPANAADSVRLTQAIAPPVSIPNLLPVAQTNVRQRGQDLRTEQQAEEALLRERQRALELARQQFINDIAKPILARSR